jgi:hypothetical protein
MGTEWVSFGWAGIGSWIMIAGWTIGLAILAWWFFMPNPMDRDRKSKKKS